VYSAEPARAPEAELEAADVVIETAVRLSAVVDDPTNESAASVVIPPVANKFDNVTF
jgi:hypothetical protein